MGVSINEAANNSAFTRSLPIGHSNTWYATSSSTDRA
jgi:hypothetical protein